MIPRSSHYNAQHLVGEQSRKSKGIAMWAVSLGLLGFWMPMTIASASSSCAQSVTYEQEEVVCSFIPPHGWEYVKGHEMPQDVRVVVRGKGKGALPPSMNLAIEKVSCTQEEYVQVAKKLHQADPQASWSDLGTLQTSCGKANLWQIDIKTQWGEVRVLQAMRVSHGQAFVLSAAALKSEFPTFSKELLAALRTLSLNDHS